MHWWRQSNQTAKLNQDYCNDKGLISISLSHTNSIFYLALFLNIIAIVAFLIEQVIYRLKEFVHCRDMNQNLQKIH